jgi:hypothetical protein
MNSRITRDVTSCLERADENVVSYLIVMFMSYTLPYHPIFGGGFGILNGCASVLSTKSSKLMTSGSENTRKKYLSVSAIQKLCSLC